MGVVEQPTDARRRLALIVSQRAEVVPVSACCVHRSKGFFDRQRDREIPEGARDRCEADACNLSDVVVLECAAAKLESL